MIPVADPIPAEDHTPAGPVLAFPAPMGREPGKFANHRPLLNGIAARVNILGITRATALGAPVARVSW